MAKGSSKRIGGPYPDTFKGTEVVSRVIVKEPAKEPAKESAKEPTKV